MILEETTLSKEEATITIVIDELVTIVVVRVTTTKIRGRIAWEIKKDPTRIKVKINGNRLTRKVRDFVEWLFHSKCQ